MTNTVNAVSEAVIRSGGLIAVASDLQIHPNTVSSWVKRQYIPKYSYAKKLAQLSGFSVDVLRPVGRVK